MDFENQWDDQVVKHPFEQVIAHDYFEHHAVHPEKALCVEMGFSEDWGHAEPAKHFDKWPLSSETWKSMGKKNTK